MSSSGNGRNVTATHDRLGEYRAMVAAGPVSETHFQFNAIVQNQLPRSSRNIREKFTAESVLLARHRPNLSRTIPILDPRDFNLRNYSHLGCRPDPTRRIVAKQPWKQSR